LVADQGALLFDAVRYGTNMMQCVIFVKFFFKKILSEIFDIPGRKGGGFAVRNPYYCLCSCKMVSRLSFIMGRRSNG
jgi:hypothetical protein